MKERKLQISFGDFVEILLKKPHNTKYAFPLMKLWTLPSTMGKPMP